MLLAFSLRDAASGAQRKEASFFQLAGEVCKLPGFFVLLIVFAAASVGNALVYAWLPLYLYENFAMSLTQAGFAATFWVQIASVAGILIGGTLADLYAQRSELGRVRTQGFGICIAAPFLFLTGATSYVPFLIAGLIAFGIGRGMFDSNAMPVLSQLAKPDLRATGYGLLNLAGTVASGLTTLAAGLLKSSVGIGGCFEAAAVILLFSSFLLLRMKSLPSGNAT